MADVTYRIVTELSSSGSLGAGNLAEGKLAAMDNSISKIGSGLKGIGSSLSDVFTGVVEKVASVGFSLAKIGAMAAFGAVTGGVAALNNNLEQTQMSLAAIFTANGASANMIGGMAEAGAIIRKMRDDSAALPISFQDAAMVMKTIATSGFRSGAGVNEIESLATKTATFANIENISGRVAAREMATLLAGHATSQNVIALRLGIDPKSFRAMDASKRFEFLNEALGAYTDKSTATFAHSFKALFTTLKNNVEFSFLQPATLPLFNKIKTEMESINHWFSDNRSKIEGFAGVVGDKLGTAFDIAKNKLLEWAPIIKDFVTDAVHKLEDIWNRIKPIVEYLGGIIRDSLRNSDSTFEKIGGVLTAYSALKLAGPIMQAGSALGPEGTAVAGAGVVAAAMMAHAIENSPEAARQAHSALVNFNGAMIKLGATWDRLSPTVMGVVDQLGTNMVKGLNAWLGFAETMAGEYNHLFKGFSGMIDKMKDKMETEANLLGFSIYSNGNNKGDSNLAKYGLLAWAKTGIEEIAKRDDKDGKGKKDVTGGGGTKIGSINLYIQQTGDPQRVARAVMDKLADVQRYKRNSPWVPNFSSSR